MTTSTKDLTDRDTFNAATSQEVFDFIAHHLLTQDEPSLSELGTDSCAYHGQNGLKCAAGCLIPDELYQLTFENYPWLAINNELGFTSHSKLVSELQTIHDGFESSHWKLKLNNLAESKNLSTAILEQFN